MRLAKAAAITAGFIGAFGLGVWIGPSVTDRTDRVMETAVRVATPDSVETKRQARATRTARVTTAAEAPVSAKMIDVSAPELHQRLKPTLNRGADMSKASSGFKDAEQFAIVAHA